MKAMEAPAGGGVFFPSTMSDQPLAIRYILEHAVRNHARKGIVARDGDRIVRFTYPAFAKRVAQLAHALRELGVRPGDRVATFAWNGHRHMELYYAVPMIGAVLHPVNIRLFPDQVVFILDHAGDSVVFFDGSLAKAVNAFRALERTGARRYVALSTPAEPVAGALDYETLVAGKPESYDWPEIDERTGALICYTSATTGDPKGVVYSHRTIWIHALGAGLPDFMGLRERDRVLPVVPMFHVGAWAFPFLCPMSGADLVLPMERLDPPGVVELLESEKVTVSAGVPTVWLGVREILEKTGKRLPHLRKLVCGGSAMPHTLRDYLVGIGIDAQHAWGMTEMSPIGTMAYVSSEVGGDEALARAESYKVGKFCPIVQWRVVDEHGNDVAQDGAARGELLVRGYAVTARYLNNDDANARSFTADGWFHTGDVVTVDEYGYLDIVDRVKDFIKSGGEWISSVEVENTIMGHPAIKEACVFGVPHPKWQERPVAAVVVRDGEALDPDALRAWLEPKLAKWQTPDRFFFVETIPRTGVGKFLKRDLRVTYASTFADEG